MAKSIKYTVDQSLPPAKPEDFDAGIRAAQDMGFWGNADDFKEVSRQMVDIHHPLFERGGAKAGWKFGQLKKLREKELRKAIKSSLDYKDKSDVDRLMQWATFGILPTLIAFEIEPKYPVLVDGFNRYYLANGMGWKKIPVSVFRYLGEEENES